MQVCGPATSMYTNKLLDISQLSIVSALQVSARVDYAADAAVCVRGGSSLAARPTRVCQDVHRAAVAEWGRVVFQAMCRYIRPASTVPQRPRSCALGGASRWV